MLDKNSVGQILKLLFMLQVSSLSKDMASLKVSVEICWTVLMEVGWGYDDNDDDGDDDNVEDDDDDDDEPIPQ